MHKKHWDFTVFNQSLAIRTLLYLNNIRYIIPVALPVMLPEALLKDNHNLNYQALSHGGVKLQIL